MKNIVDSQSGNYEGFLVSQLKLKSKYSFKKIKNKFRRRN
jgi:hypothetical protein